MSAADVRLAAILGHRDLFVANIAERYAAIVAATDDAVIDTSLDGTVLGWNPGAERMYGFAMDEALGRHVPLIAPTDPPDAIPRALEAIARGERVDRLASIGTRRDRTRFEVSLAVSGIRNVSGAIVGASIIGREIGGANGAEAQLRQVRGALAESDGFLAKAERLSRTGSWVLEFGSPPLITCSHECYRVLGIEAFGPITIERFFSFVHPDDAENVNATMLAALAEHRVYETEFRIVAADGHLRRVQVWAEPEYDEHEKPTRVLGVVQDITDRFEADEALRASERRFRLLAENARDFIFRLVILPETKYDYVSPASVTITGYTPEELYADPGLTISLLAEGHMTEMEGVIASGEQSEPMEVMTRRKDGSTLWVSQQLTFIRDDAGELTAVEGIIRDISERKRAEAAFAYAGLHDALTGLSNRSLLRDRVELARTQARAAGSSVIVVALDLDDFTLINDTRGPQIGDVVLVTIAERLVAATGRRATVSRTGSDEFVIIGYGIEGDDDAVTFVESVREVLTEPIPCGDAELFVQACIGVTIDNPNAAPESLLRNADIALQRAKHNRTGSGVQFFNSDMRTRTDERFALVGDLHRAIERNELELRYQPIIRLTDCAIIGSEALIRWRHPERGLINPADFIPLAEETGLIVDIGAWVIERACAQLRAFSNADPAFADLGMSVNVSVKQLRSPGITETVAGALERSGIERGRLTVEMTESVFADDLDAIGSVLAELRALGVRIAVDDFGTGYSSFAYLKNLPLDTLKIDQTFIEGLGTDPCDAAIVASALSVSRALGLVAVAEGVETSEQLAALRTLGCTAAQGYYFSKPVTDTELAALVAHPTW